MLGMPLSESLAEVANRDLDFLRRTQPGHVVAVKTQLRARLSHALATACARRAAAARHQLGDYALAVKSIQSGHAAVLDAASVAIDAVVASMRSCLELHPMSAPSADRVQVSPGHLPGVPGDPGNAGDLGPSSDPQSDFLPAAALEVPGPSAYPGADDDALSRWADSKEETLLRVQALWQGFELNSRALRAGTLQPRLFQAGVDVTLRDLLSRLNGLLGPELSSRSQALFDSGRLPHEVPRSTQRSSGSSAWSGKAGPANPAAQDVASAAHQDVPGERYGR